MPLLLEDYWQASAVTWLSDRYFLVREEGFTYKKRHENKFQSFLTRVRKKLQLGCKVLNRGGYEVVFFMKFEKLAQIPRKLTKLHSKTFPFSEKIDKKLTEKEIKELLGRAPQLRYVGPLSFLPDSSFKVKQVTFSQRQDPCPNVDETVAMFKKLPPSEPPYVPQLGIYAQPLLESTPVFYSSNQFAGLAPVPNHHFDPGPSEHSGYLTSSASYTSSPYYHRDSVLYACNVNSMQRDVLALPSEPPDPAPYLDTEPNYCSSGTPLHAQYIPKQSRTNNNTPAPGLYGLSNIESDESPRYYPCPSEGACSEYLSTVQQQYTPLQSWTGTDTPQEEQSELDAYDAEFNDLEDVGLPNACIPLLNATHHIPPMTGDIVAPAQWENDTRDASWTCYEVQQRIL